LRSTLEKSYHKKTSFARWLSLTRSVSRQRAKRIRVVSVTAIKRAVNHKAASGSQQQQIRKTARLVLPLLEQFRAQCEKS